MKTANMIHELKLPISGENRNPINGQYQKKHIPHNKGKGWKSWMPKDKQEKVLSKLNRNGKKYHKNKDAPNAKPVIAFYQGKIVGRFKSTHIAARKMQLYGSLIRKCARGERKRYGGFQFKYEKDL